MATKTKSKSTGQTGKKPPAKKGGSRKADRRVNDIATAAYFKAEQRGFAPGRELEDWLEAEAEILTRH